MIIDAIQAEVDRHGSDDLRAISSCASGGDILFLEACAGAGIRSEIFLALTEEEFAAASVEGAGPGWVERFHRLCDATPVHILTNADQSTLNVYQQTNLWMLDVAFAHNNAGVTVMVLWDGAAGDGAGGTKDMVQRASEAGATVIHLDANELVR